MTAVVPRLPDSKVPWVTRRDHLAYLLDQNPPKMTVNVGTEWELGMIRECVEALQRDGHGPETEVEVTVGGPLNLEGGRTVDPWTGEVHVNSR